MTRHLGAVALAFVCVACGGAGTTEQEFGAINAVVQAVSSGSITRVTITATPANVSTDLAPNATTGAFSGTLAVPVGAQTITASAYASSTLVGTASTSVTIANGATANVSLTILDTSAPPVPPDRSPVIAAFVTPKTTITKGEAMVVAVEAVDLDGDALSYSWTSAPAGCGTFSDSTAASTQWTAQTSGTCRIQVTVSARGKTDTKFSDVAVIEVQTGAVAVSGTFVSRPSIALVEMFDATNSTDRCLFRAGAPDTMCRLTTFTAGHPVRFDVQWKDAPTATASVTDTCGGSYSVGFVGDNGPGTRIAQITWSSPNAGVCGVNVAVAVQGLTDLFPTGLVLGAAAL